MGDEFDFLLTAAAIILILFIIAIAIAMAMKPLPVPLPVEVQDGRSPDRNSNPARFVFSGPYTLGYHP